MKENRCWPKHQADAGTDKDKPVLAYIGALPSLFNGAQEAQPYKRTENNSRQNEEGVYKDRGT